MPARRRAFCFALAASVALSATYAPRARADACGPPLLSTCINDDNFWPHAGPAQFLAIGSTETVARGQVGFGLVTSYLSRPIVFHLPAPGPGGSDAFAINDQVNETFMWSYGVTNRLEVDAILPITLGQGGSGTAPITGANPSTALRDTALRDPRFGFAYAIIPRARRDPHVIDPDAPAAGTLFALTARFEMSAPFGDQTQFAGERAAVWIPSLAGDFRKDRIFAGVEVGARLRPVEELAGARVGSQLTFAAGAGVDVLPHEMLSAVLEARALPTFAEQHDPGQTAEGLTSTPNGRLITPAEWALSLRTAPFAGGDLAVQLGGGGAIPFSSDAAITNPRFRFSLSIRYEPVARDTDGDGVLDKDDMCPGIRGVKGGLGGDGCPPSRQRATLDNSATMVDRCPAEPELVDGFTDDACPDQDTDKDGIPNRYDRCPLEAEDYAGLQDGCPNGAEDKKPATPPARP